MVGLATPTDEEVLQQVSSGSPGTLHMTGLELASLCPTMATRHSSVPATSFDICLDELDVVQQELASVPGVVRLL